MNCSILHDKPCRKGCWCFGSMKMPVFSEEAEDDEVSGAGLI